MMTSVWLYTGTLVFQAMIERQEPNYFPTTNKLKTRLKKNKQSTRPRGTQVKAGR